MNRFWNRRSIVGGVLSAALTAAGQAHALLIIPSFDSTLTGNANAAALEAAINTSITAVDGLFANPGTVQILFEFNAGVHGQSSNGVSNLSYSGSYTGNASSSGYVATLTHDAAAHPSNTVLATALANISKGNKPTTVQGTTAFLRVGLGLSGAGTTPCFYAGGIFDSACGGIYDAIISVGNLSTASNGAGFNSDAVSVVEHEINEVLGGGGGGTTLGSGDPATIMGPLDLYRYGSSGSSCANVNSTPSYTTSSGVVSCYSINGGSTALVQFNQAGGGSDYGDFAFTGTPAIQDAFDSGTTAIYSTSSPEYTMMQSIGWYSTANVPEPSVLALFVGAIAGLGWLRRRTDAAATQPG